HQGEARAGGGIQQGEVTLGDATGPQPGERFTGCLREEVGGRPGRRRFLKLLLLFGQGAFVAGNVALDVALDEVGEGARCHRYGPFGMMTGPWRRSFIAGWYMVE